MSILIKRSQIPILIINVIMLIFFSVFYTSRLNYEFMIYIGVIIFFLCLIILTNNKVRYSNFVLWGLTLWALLHMAGGSLQVQGSRLYELILINISQAYSILRYDQFVHIIGFGIATFIMYEIVSHSLKKEFRWPGLLVVIAMAGLGIGALNEIVEFIVTVLVPRTGIGGYMNSLLDLTADLVGAIIAAAIIYFRKS